MKRIKSNKTKFVVVLGSKTCASRSEWNSKRIKSNKVKYHGTQNDHELLKNDYEPQGSLSELNPKRTKSSWNELPWNWKRRRTSEGSWTFRSSWSFWVPGLAPPPKWVKLKADQIKKDDLTWNPKRPRTFEASWCFRSSWSFWIPGHAPPEVYGIQSESSQRRVVVLQLKTTTNFWIEWMNERIDEWNEWINWWTNWWLHENESINQPISYQSINQSIFELFFVFGACFNGYEPGLLRLLHSGFFNKRSLITSLQKCIKNQSKINQKSIKK